MSDKAEQPTITQSDRQLWKFIIDASKLQCACIDREAPTAPELQAIAKHRTTSLAAQDGLVEAAGVFPRIVTHEQALDAARNFIDAHFNNKDGKGVLTGIPARPDHDDLLLTDYIRQQRALSAIKGDK